METTSDGVHDAACTACEMAVVWIQNQLKLNLNQIEKQILNYANEFCERLPSPSGESAVQCNALSSLPSISFTIGGKVFDLAPEQVWASGFSAAFLKKHSVATKGTTNASESGMDALVDNKAVVAPKHAVTEAALLLVLEKFFEVVLNLPTVNRLFLDALLDTLLNCY